MKQFLFGSICGAIISTITFASADLYISGTTDDGSVKVGGPQFQVEGDAAHALPIQDEDILQGFTLSGGRVGQFNAEGDLLPRESRNIGDSFPIRMTPSGKVVCSDYETLQLIHKIANYIGMPTK